MKTENNTSFDSFIFSQISSFRWVLFLLDKNIFKAFKVFHLSSWQGHLKEIEKVSKAMAWNIRRQIKMKCSKCPEMF